MVDKKWKYWDLHLYRAQFMCSVNESLMLDIDSCIPGSIYDLQDWYAAPSCPAL